LEKLSEIIENHKNFVISSHVNPDGDSIGSTTALCKYLRNSGKNAVVVNHSPTPDNYKFMDTECMIEVYDETKHRERIAEAEVLFVLDTNEYERLRSVSDAFKTAKGLKVCIDHHMGFKAADYDYGLIDTDSPATAQILFKFFKAQDRNSFTPEIATSLYVGIMTDTGSFRFPRTTEETLRIASELVELGADPVKAADRIYNNASFNKLKLLSIFLNNMKLEEDGQLGYSFLRKNDFAITATDLMDTEGFSHNIMSLATVRLGIVFTESERGVKISFRSKDVPSVNDIAKVFRGGGHANAAGAFISGKSLDDVLKEVLDKSKEYIN
jgi:phosphoesterase RecJ-like protein